MQLYRGTINVGKGLVKQEVHRGFTGNNQMTAAEVMLLRAIHGDDAVYNLEPMGDARVSHQRERRRLELRYGEKYVDAVWGASQMNTRLPEIVDLQPESARDVQDMPDDPANFGDLDIPPIEGNFSEHAQGEKSANPVPAPAATAPKPAGARGRKRAAPAVDLDLEPLADDTPAPAPVPAAADAFAGA